jgi:TetR/AcrR family transcriptional regulator, repressor for uid operon
LAAAGAMLQPYSQRLMRMNVHSHWLAMSLIATSAARRTADAERRQRILEAGERAFVRNGFHATTMQHVADEVGMSAGNLYRYFPSKEAIVEGLCELDQVEVAQAFAELMADNRHILESMRFALRKHVLAKPPDKARLLVEIWAEAGRNPRVAQLSRAIDAEVRARVEGLIDAAKAAGVAAPRLDSRFGARFLVTFVAGLFKRIAIEDDFNSEVETPMAIGVLKALLAGALCPDPGEEPR